MSMILKVHTKKLKYMYFKQYIELKLKSFDTFVLERAVKRIVCAISRINARYKGPIPLPMNISKFTLNRSPFVDKKSREQLEMRHHSRFLIIEALPQTIENLMKLEISAAVDIKIKMKGL